MARKIALLIGCLHYSDPKLKRLAKPDADVRALARVLEEPAIGGFDEVRPIIDADSSVVRRAIAQHYAAKTADDLLLLYFAGHGVKDELGQLYLALADTDADLLSGTAVPADFIAREMDRSRSRRQMLILDCCFSGAFAGTRAAENVGTASAFANAGSGQVILTATDSFQYSWENETRIAEANSVFTHFLVKGLESGAADLNGDGVITADEWYDYVYAEVRASTPKQTPQRTVHAGAGSLVVAQNPHTSTPLPDEVVKAINSPLPYVREGVVHELERLVVAASPAIAASARKALEELKTDRDQRVRELARKVLEVDGAPARPAAEPIGGSPIPPPPRRAEGRVLTLVPAEALPWRPLRNAAGMLVVLMAGLFVLFGVVAISEYTEFAEGPILGSLMVISGFALVVQWLRPYGRTRLQVYSVLFAILILGIALVRGTFAYADYARNKRLEKAATEAAPTDTGSPAVTTESTIATDTMRTTDTSSTKAPWIDTTKAPWIDTTRAPWIDTTMTSATSGTAATTTS